MGGGKLRVGSKMTSYRDGADRNASSRSQGAYRETSARSPVVVASTETGGSWVPAGESSSRSSGGGSAPGSSTV